MAFSWFPGGSDSSADPDKHVGNHPGTVRAFEGRPSSDVPSKPGPGASDAGRDRPSTASTPTVPEVVGAGQADGRSDVSADDYVASLNHAVAVDRLADRAQAVRGKISALDDRIHALTTLQEQSAVAAADREQLEDQHASLSEKHAHLERSIEAAEEEQRAKKKRGSLIYATLYTTAGLFFIAGDVIMSREIVANALKLPGMVEPWIFAIGLAMLAILVKPAYDRLVEEPYWQGTSGRFAVTITVCAIGALSTLWILGAFRSTAFVNNTKIQRLTTELLQTDDPARIGEIEQQVVGLQQSLVESPLGYWAFVLSGVLFALAGAVCLGIGLRHVRDAYHLRWPLFRTRRQLVEKRDEIASRMEDLRAEIQTRHAAIARAHHRLSTAPPVATLRESRDALQTQYEALLDERANAHAEWLEATYARARAHGEQSSAVEGHAVSPGASSGDGSSSPRDPGRRGHLATNGRKASTSTSGRNGLDTPPHAALRSIIRQEGL